MPKNKYRLKAKVWVYPGDAAWHFVSIPKKESAKIKADFHAHKRGWGSLPVMAVLGKTTWKTSIFPDSKSGIYLLPVKSQVRKKEGIIKGSSVSFLLEIVV